MELAAGFTPGASLAGGALIGLAAALLLLLNGRVAGVSGILGGLLQRGADERWERIAFIAGLLAGPALFALLAWPPSIVVAASPAVLIVAGLLVGYGTRLGSGCTSGHGICGVARLSPRSLAATGLFMLAGMATVYAARHWFLMGFA
ncbi:MAG: YeeE/YedE family protein [Alphaproteobacteria bacterium]